MPSASVLTVRASCAILLCLTFACAGPGDEDDPVVQGPMVDGGVLLDASLNLTPSDASLYPPDSTLQVQLTVAPADWDQIRNEGRNINQSFSGCHDPTFAYSFVPASVRVDGEPFALVGLRKKGYIGSISASKPSLRLDFGEYTHGQTLRGQKDLTLNNSRSDASLLHTCLAYRFFAAAGLPVPRCSFARVTVNERDLGIYVNVEPVKKPLLLRYFGDDSGNLYEGNSGADFSPGHLDRFEKKTHETSSDRSDLLRVQVALEQSDKLLLEQLEPLVDLEAFFRFWAAETIVGAWDGYTGDLNNFFVYHDPTSGKLSFLPGTPDDSFSKNHAFLPPAGQRPIATYAYARLPNRLFAYGPSRQRYYETLRQLLATAWNEAALLAEADQMLAVVGPSANPSVVERLRDFIMNRRADIERELLAPDVPWTLGERPLSMCKPETVTPFRARFVTTWAALQTPVVAAENSLSIVLDGAPRQFAAVLASAGGSAPSGSGAAGATLRMIGSAADGTLLIVQFVLPAAPTPGELPLHGFETFGVVLTGREGGAFTTVGYVGEGKLSFEQASAEPGSPLVGSIEGKAVQTRPLSARSQ